MPELPEVETIVRGLRNQLKGKVFSAIEIGWENSIRTDREEITTILPGKRIISLDRRGKYIVFTLQHEWYLIIHLKMSGRLLLQHADDEVHPHVRTSFFFHDGSSLRFQDMRKFGRVYFLQNSDSVLGNLGPEPLADSFTLQEFQSLFEKRTGRLKPLLLNQQFIAGLGNIYADESCFTAGLHPAISVNMLKKKHMKKLYHAIRGVLECGIMNNGASLDEIYQGGSFQNHFCVYGRTGKACTTCQTPIERIVLAGRSTHFCPSCQGGTRRH